MNNLKNSIVFLFAYLTLVLGIAQVRYVEENVLNFEPVFFIIMALAVLAGIFAPSLVQFSIYVFLTGWAIVYGLVWGTYWQFHNPTLSFQVLGIQFILVIISAGLSFDVGRQIQLLGEFLEGLSANTYPNRTLEMSEADRRISAEITRSRRYHHPLSLLIIKLCGSTAQQDKKQLDILQKDLLHRFASAKMGQIISDHARETDLIIRDQFRRFVVVCPETDSESSAIFAERITLAVQEGMGAEVVWGSASFPNEALTFDELLEQAEVRLRSKPALPQPASANHANVKSPSE